MKLFEFEAKEILRKYGVATPRGSIASTPDEVETIARQLGTPVALKSQILVAGRGKAGGIAFADDPATARIAATNLIGKTIKGCRVDSLLVEEKLNISEQYYASIVIDRQARRYVALASASGGVDIEQTAANSTDAVSRHRIDPDAGFDEREAEWIVERIPKISQHILKSVREKKVDPYLKEDVSSFALVLTTLFRIAMDYDAELVEINPLAKVASGRFVAADARMILDDNALFRHPEFKDRSLVRADDSPMEAEARKQDLTYVDLSGDIGIVGNGAGMVMATMDMIRYHGGEPANFLDIGGGAQAEVIKKGLTLVISKPEVKAVLVNILGGITRCDEVARGVLQALDGAGSTKPIAVRMMGTNEREGTEMLVQAGVRVYADMETATQEIMKLKERQSP